MSAQPIEDAPIHPVHQDGRVMHSFFKIDGEWVCACGEVRDRFGVPR